LETPINYVAWSFWREIIVLGGLVANIVYTWWINREKVTAKRFAALEKDVAQRVTKADLEAIVANQGAPCRTHLSRTIGLEDRATRAELEIKHLPNHADLAKLSSRIEEIHADLHEIAGGVSGLRRAVDLMNEYLINNGGKR
jgi:hypothetical protein